MLPDVTGKITRGFQLHDPTTVEHIMWNVVLGDVIETLSILSLPLSGEEVTVAWSADRAGDERVFERNPLRVPVGQYWASWSPGARSC